LTLSSVIYKISNQQISGQKHEPFPNQFAKNIIDQKAIDQNKFSISGDIEAVRVGSNGAVVIVLDTKGEYKAICLMDPKQKEYLMSYKIGSKVKLNGLYIGYTSEIIMVNCKISKS